MYGLNTDGNAILLPFGGTANPGYAAQSSPGPIAPQAYGQFLTTTGLNNCTKPTPTYAKLLIRLASGAELRMPYPGSSFVTGCYNSVGTAGAGRPQ